MNTAYSRRSGLSSALRHRRLVIFLALVFTVTSLAHFSFVPVWDGWVNLHCYASYAQSREIEGVGHSALFHTVLFGITQLPGPGDCRLVYLFNVLLGLTGIAFFSMLLARLFGEALSAAERGLLAFLFGLSPVFLVHVVQPAIDYTLPIFFIILLYALFKERFVLACLAGMMLIFTKESGLALYAAGVCLYVLFFSIPGRRFKWSWKGFMNVFLILLPVAAFVIYALRNPPHVAIGSSWQAAMKIYASSPLFDGFFRAQLFDLTVLSFNWLLTVCILAGIMARLFLAPYTRGRGLQRRERFFFFSLLFVLLFSLTRFKFVNNPRYILPLLPLLVIVFADSLLILISRRAIRLMVLLSCIGLFYASAFRTFDPLSKKIYGTFAFGSHRMLKMSAYTPGQNRDELVYNYEFMYMPRLTEAIVNRFGFDKTYVANRDISWLNFHDFSFFDRSSGRRSPLYRDALQVHFITPEAALAQRPPEAYCIGYPNLPPSEDAITRLSAVYDVKEQTQVSQDGYGLAVIHLVAR